MGKTVLPIGAVSLLLVTITLAQAPQQPQPAPDVTFQVNVNYVDVDAVVTDEQGNVITDLTIDDFELFEDGIPQNIETFSYIDVSREQRRHFFGVDSRPISSDVRSNGRPVTGRMYIIVLDDLDVSPLRTADVKQAARQFVEEYFHAGDVAAVVHTSGRSGTQDFTSDPELLLASIDKFMGLRLRSQELEKVDEYYKEQIAKGLGMPTLPKNVVSGENLAADLSDFERSHRAINVLTTMKALTEFLAEVRGRRKALVMFSEGIDYVEKNPFAMRSVIDVVRATQDAINTAARSNVNFYTIDPRGLAGASEFVGMRGSGRPQSSTSVALMDELQASQDSLRTLAEQTGGFAALTSNSFASAFRRIVDFNSRYYMLGYAPQDSRRRGRFHTIDVRVKRPGLRVVARSGYTSPRENTAGERVGTAPPASEAIDSDERTKSDKLRAVLDAPLPQGGLSLSVHAAPFKSTKDTASVALAIEVGGDSLPLSPPAGNAVGSHIVELSFFAIDASGQAGSGTRTELDLTRLTPEMYARAKSHGIRFNPRLTLAPGRYQLRVGARESIVGTTGSVFYDLTVPDFHSESLVLSGLLVTTVSAQQTPTAERDPVLAKVLPGAATSERAFPSGDTLAIYLELYGNNSSDKPRQIEVSVRLISEGEEDLFTSANTIVNAGQQSGRWDVGAEIPLLDLEPGRYLLRVDAQIRGEIGTPVARETVITITP